MYPRLAWYSRLSRHSRPRSWLGLITGCTNTTSNSNKTNFQVLKDVGVTISALKSLRNIVQAVDWKLETEFRAQIGGQCGPDPVALHLCLVAAL